MEHNLGMPLTASRSQASPPGMRRERRPHLVQHFHHVLLVLRLPAVCVALGDEWRLCGEKQKARAVALEEIAAAEARRGDGRTEPYALVGFNNTPLPFRTECTRGITITRGSSECVGPRGW